MTGANAGPVPQWGRSTAAVSGGILAVFVLSLGTDQILHMANVYPLWGQPMFDTGLLLLATAYRAVYSTVGGCITARLAPHNSMRHVRVLVIVGFVLGLMGIGAAISMPDLSPLWYPIAVAVTGPPMSWLGGMLFRPTARG